MGKLNKLEWKNIYYMICYCVDELVYFEDSNIDYEDLKGTHDLLAALLCSSFETLYKNGYIKEYNKEQIVTDKPRGRVDIPRSISKGHIGKSKLDCRVSNLSIDSKLNRIIKSAFSILIDTNSRIDDKIDSKLIAKLNTYRNLLRHVSDIQISYSELKDLSEIPQWYRPIISVCKFILYDWLAFDSEGKHRLLELKDEKRLCYIWQKYLFQFCKIRYSEYKVNRPVFGSGRHTWKTDLVIADKKNKVALIVDAKWYESSSMSTANIAQVNTYESKYMNKHKNYTTNGLLLYASSNQTKIYEPEMMDNGKAVTEVEININQDKESLENDILNIIEQHLNEKVT